MEDLILKELNCLSEICPLPMIMLINLRKEFPSEDIFLITDHSCVPNNIIRYCEINKLSISVEEPISGVWELFIKVPKS